MFKFDLAVTQSSCESPVSSQSGSNSSSMLSGFQIQKNLVQYYVMQRYGPSLRLLQKAFEEPLPPKDVCNLSLQILQALKIMHDSGVVFNNLTIDHVLVGDEQFSPDSRSQIKIVNYCKAKLIIGEGGKVIRNDGEFYKEPIRSQIEATYQKRSDIMDLQKLMLELGVDIDLQVKSLQPYDTPNYEMIKTILNEKMQEDNNQNDYVWSIPDLENKFGKLAFENKNQVIEQRSVDSIEELDFELLNEEESKQD